jgi:hypothetical protein
MGISERFEGTKISLVGKMKISKIVCSKECIRG